MRALIATILLSACGVTDVVDGRTEDPGDCCWLIDDDVVAQCVRESVDDWSVYDLNEDGCLYVRCFPATFDFSVLVCPAE